MKDKIRVEFEMEQKMCTTCKKTSTEYYELKLQLRFVYYDSEDLIEKIKDKVTKLISVNFNGINKFSELDNGYDIFFRDLGEINKISKLFNKHFFCEEKRSRKIVGHNFLETKDIWRHTLLVNIINLNVGDRVQIKGIDYYIKAFNKNDLVLREEKNGSKNVVNYSIVKDYFKKL